MSEIWNLSTLCRCCHSDGCFKKLNLPYPSENSVEIYETMLQEALGIQVLRPTMDQASYMICDDCIKRLRDAFQFQQQVLACEQKFKVYCTNEQFQVKTEVELNDAENFEIDVQEDIHGDDDYSEKDDQKWHSVPVKEDIKMNITAYEDDSSMDETLASTSKNSDAQSTILDGSFFEIIPNLYRSRSVVALCKICLPNRVEIKGNRNCTSNFKTHLKRKHGDETVREYEAYVKSKRCKIVSSSARGCREKYLGPVELSLQSQTPTNLTYSQSDFDQDLVKYFVSSMVSLSSVEDPYFRQLLQRSNPSLQIMNRPDLVMNVFKYFIHERTRIVQELGEVKHVYVTVDIWSTSQTSLIGVIAHWLDRYTLNRTSKALACESFKNTESRDTVHNMLREITAIFHLDHDKQVTYHVLRKENNIVKAFEIFGVHPCNISSEEERQSRVESPSHTEESDNDSTDNKLSIEYYLTQHLPDHLKCATHILNQCAIDASEILEDIETELSKIHHETLKKCNNLWTASESGQVIYRILGHGLTKPNSTKWNSIYVALKEIYNIKDKYKLIQKALQLKNPISETEFQYLNEYLMCTQPIADALDVLQGENAQYYGILFPTILVLKKKLIRLLGQEDTFKYCKRLIQAYLNSVECHFKDYQEICSEQAEIAALAAITHPTYTKFKWTSLIGQSQFLRLKNLLIREVSRNIPTENLKPLPKSKEDEFFDFDSSSDSDLNNGTMSKAELIVFQYFTEESTELSSLNNHVEIKDLFIKYNTPIPSSACVPRMFCNKTIKYTHINEDTEMFDRRLMLKMNLND